MAVYTILHHHEIQTLLSRFDLPNLTSFEGASSGIENSTYFLTLATGAQYVLTVFEHFSANILTPYVALMSLLNQQNLPVPCPCLDHSGAALQTVAGKPALLFSRAQGRHIAKADADSCRQVGLALAHLHQSNTASLKIANPCGRDWMIETFAFVKDSLNKSDQQLVEEQITLSADLERRKLPEGIIHGDLFRDNVLFHDGDISALIDFYNAGRDVLLLDLAIVINDWCYTDIDGREENANALLGAYKKVRPLSEPETYSWNDCLRVAATRFWLSRQKRVVLASSGSTHVTKDPSEYRNLLLFHIKQPKLLPFK